MKKFLLLLSIFASFLIIYKISSAGKTPYDYFTRLSTAFLQGKYWLSENPPWLSELIPAGDNKFYVVYPPMPAILSIPFIIILGNNFQQQYLAHLLGAGLVTTTILISWKIKKDKILAVWSGLLVGLGSIVWYLASVGSSWYLGQIAAALFLAIALLEGLTQKRPFLVGMFLGAAYLSRIHTILSLPIFIFLINPRLEAKKFINFFSGLVPFVFFDAIYNFVRFGVIWDIGYTLIPGVLNEIWFQKGIIHPTYILNNLKVAFASFPKRIDKFPYLTPSWAGLAIWITTPAFVYSLFANLKEKLVKFLWLAIIPIALFVFSHGTTGFAQFGYRFAVDFYPFLVLLTIKGVAKTGLKWYHWLLLIAGIIVNLWGVLWINKFGWVSY